MTKKIIATLMIVTLTGSMLAACASNSSTQSTQQDQNSSQSVESTADSDWRTPYEETVTVTFARSGSTESPKFPSGETIDNNAYTKWILERFNIKVVNAWMTDTEYTQKLALSLASKDIPDVVMVLDRTQLIQMIEGGLLTNMSGVIDQYASPLVKSIYEAQGGYEVMFRDCKGDDGNSYAIPASEPIQYNLTWIRSDWLEELGLAIPKTMDELIDAARAFVKADLAGDGNTVGIALNHTVADNPNSVNNALPIFGFYNAYPRVWHIDDATGKYTYGSITDETRKALTFLASLYKEGIFSPEFATIDPNTHIAANYAGIFFGAWWTGAWPLADGKANDPGIEWIPIWINDDNGNYNVFPINRTQQWVVVRHDYKNPEVAVKLANLCADQQNLFRTEEFDDYPSDIPAEVDTAYKNLEWKLDWGAWPVNILLRYPDQMVRLEKVWNNLLARRDAGEEIPEFSTESFNADLILSYRNGNDDSSQGFHVYTKTLALTLLAKNEKSSLVLKDAVYPPVTDEFDLYWSNLKDLEDAMFLKIVTGQEPISYFDTFRDSWLAQGGEELIGIVNELY